MDEQTTPTAAVRDAGPLEFARMSASRSRAATPLPWVTDFLNAAYYRRPVADRDVDDLRAAFCVLTTGGRRAAGLLHQLANRIAA